MAKSAYNPNSHQQKNRKQIIVYSVVPLSNKTTNTCNNVNESQKHKESERSQTPT